MNGVKQGPNSRRVHRLSDDDHPKERVKLAFLGRIHLGGGLARSWEIEPECHDRWQAGGPRPL